jgi:hypothetical protein
VTGRGQAGRHAAPRRRRALWLVAAFVAVDLVVGVLALTVVPRVGPWSGDGAPDPSTGTMAGYPVLNGNQGLPIEVGRPWGTSCAPVALVAGLAMPASWRRSLAEVVDEAGAAGVPVLGASTALDGRQVRTVRIDGIAGPAPSLPDGRPQQLLWVLATVTAPGGGTEHIVDLRAAVYLATTGDDAAAQRRIMRTLLARSFGLAGSTQPGSGLAEQISSTVDGFSPADLAALRTMSGCA